MSLGRWERETERLKAYPGGASWDVGTLSSHSRTQTGILVVTSYSALCPSIPHSPRDCLPSSLVGLEGLMELV